MLNYYESAENGTKEGATKTDKEHETVSKPVDSAKSEQEVIKSKVPQWIVNALESVNVKLFDS